MPEKPGSKATKSETNWLTGQLLIAMPTMADPRFAHAVIYMCSHNEQGAMGLIVNRLYGSLNFRTLLEQLDLTLADAAHDVRVHFGGPVESNRGFVLHTADYRREGTMMIDDGIGMTATVEILQELSRGQGPEQCLLALGYAGWQPGQLNAELQANGWLTSSSDTGFLFDGQLENKWERAIARLGISPAMLSGDAGHA
ncbi:MAG: YqgE/AlgH family protein [Alphaproteobacteria bacterium]|nr:YqgE/AlgH family protein [Alphaproteobacteria bacterium]